MTNPKEFRNLGILLLVIFAVGSFFYFRSQPESIGVMEELPLASDESPQEEVAEEVIIEETSVKEMVMQDEDSLIGELEDVTRGNSSGEAYILRKDGHLYHYVGAALPTPPQGMVYEGWLVRKTPTLKFFSTGVMLQENGRYVLSYDAEGESQGYNEVVITLETKVDEIPEKHVLEGVVR